MKKKGMSSKGTHMGAKFMPKGQQTITEGKGGGSLKSMMTPYGKIAKPSGDNRRNAEGKHLPMSENQGSKMFATRGDLHGSCGADGRFMHVHAKNGGGTMRPGDSKYSGPHSKNG